MEEYVQKGLLNTGDIINKGWELTKKHFPVFLLMGILMFFISELPGIPFSQAYMERFLAYGGIVSQEQWLELMITSGEYWSLFKWVCLLSFLCFFIYRYLEVVYCRMLYAATEDMKVKISVELKNARHSFWFYLGVFIVYIILLYLGIICCIIPGIFIGIRFMFAPYIAANHPNLTFSEVFLHSWQITKGHFWKLFWIEIVSLGILLIGFICCCVGVLVSIVLVHLMHAYVYKLLSDAHPILLNTDTEIFEQ